MINWYIPVGSDLTCSGRPVRAFDADMEVCDSIDIRKGRHDELCDHRCDLPADWLGRSRVKVGNRTPPADVVSPVLASDTREVNSAALHRTDLGVPLAI
jgi:hypothetical protein